MTKTLKAGAFLCKSAIALAVSVVALPALPPQARGEAEAAAKPVCLWVNRVDHTQVLNNHQILFYEIGGKIWLSNLTAPCHTLTAQDGFSWRSGIPEICGNLEQIKVLRTGEACLLGAFVPYARGDVSPERTSAPPTPSR